MDTKGEKRVDHPRDDAVELSFSHVHKVFEEISPVQQEVVLDRLQPRYQLTLWIVVTMYEAKHGEQKKALKHPELCANKYSTHRHRHGPTQSDTCLLYTSPSPRDS